MRRLLSRLELKLMKYRMIARQKLRRAGAAVAPFAITAFSLIVLFAYHPRARSILNGLQISQDLFLEAGSLIGTIIALGMSLSIIPIQRATEAFTPSISRLFREDWGIRFAFVGLIVLCLLSFSLPLGSLFGMAVQFLIPVQIIFLGMSFDLMRFTYRSTLRLLEPKEAINRLLTQSMAYISKRGSFVGKSAYLSWRLLPQKEKASTSPEAYMTVIYEQTKNQDDPLKAWAFELTEIAQRAIERAEAVLASPAINAIEGLAKAYISARRDHVVFSPQQRFSVSSSADHVLTPLYEDLLQINRTTIGKRLDVTCSSVIRALGQFAEFVVGMERKSNPEAWYYLAQGPIYYCRSSAINAVLPPLSVAGMSVRFYGTVSYSRF